MVLGSLGELFRPLCGPWWKVLIDLRGGSELKSWPMPYNIAILICALPLYPSLTFLQYLTGTDITDDEYGWTRLSQAARYTMRNNRSYFRAWYTGLSSPICSAWQSNTCVFYNTAIVTTLNSRSWGGTHGNRIRHNLSIVTKHLLNPD